ncbi:TetR/AcrR family transcriptional regulator [Spirochaeta isovalerica]|uniref:AcrR family transcriptional regulator n=1 Tax=Spirochaeta isovalerica TaxID=150 RepID=A0A841RA29_9SPIO|nr:TetR/AcrR family transcriptional regulator [Spirochaeta isovalerica]MBB6480221.1 AcrR family transcriptional regulator [Spirochaeta isovalerica]
MASKERIEREKVQLKEMREKDILEASEKLFLEKGFARTTIGDIARACELTNGAIYLYFKNKSEIILIIMTRISRSFGELLEKADDPSASGIVKAERLLGVYKHSYREYHNYHVLDGQFNVMFDKEYPDSPYLTDFFRANSRVLEIFTEMFRKGFSDGSIRFPGQVSAPDPEQSAHMFLNVLNSYVEKLSLRKELMEKEQNISMDEELNRFVDYLVASLRS